MTLRVTTLAIALTCTFPAFAQQPAAQSKPVLGGSPRVSRDGSRILFTSTSDQIVVLSADGGARRVVSDAKGNQTPSWSPDGSKILFAAGEFPNINIYTMNADGKDRQNISPNPGFDYDPVWSPDHRAAFRFMEGPG